MTRLTNGDRRVAFAAVAAVALGAVLSILLAPRVAVAIIAPLVVAVLTVLTLRARRDQLVATQDVAIMLRSMADQLERMGRELEFARREIEETRALAGLQEPGFALPLPWTGWSLPPRALQAVLTAVQQFESPTIVDCGSGVSTIHLARAVSRIGKGRVIALEQDPQWGTFIQRLLEINGLAPWATIRVAPLATTTACDRQTQWYDLREPVLPPGGQVDVLVVDGPRGDDGQLSRLGALPHFWDRLSRNAVVFLDDTRRPDEQEIARLWRERFPLTETSVGSEHGTSRFERTSR